MRCARFEMAVRAPAVVVGVAFSVGCAVPVSTGALPPEGVVEKSDASFDAGRAPPTCASRCPSGEYCYLDQPGPGSPTGGGPPDAAPEASPSSDAGSGEASDAQVAWDGAVYPSGCHPIGVDCLAKPTCSCILGELATSCAAHPPSSCTALAGGQFEVVCILGGGP